MLGDQHLILTFFMPKHVLVARRSVPTQSVYQNWSNKLRIFGIAVCLSCLCIVMALHPKANMFGATPLHAGGNGFGIMFSDA